MRRRQFLASLLASGSLPAMSWADAGNPAYIAAARDHDGAHALYGLTAQGRDTFRIPLTERGHAAAAHPHAPEVVAVARRPGRAAQVIDCISGQVTKRLEAPAGRHFYGHGSFTQDGTILVTPENDMATGEGRLGFWARDEGYRRVGDVPSGGIGPHEILTGSDGGIIVANGGIRTHPDQGRAKLNLATMRPNLSYLTPGGQITETIALPPDLHHASIRHLAERDGLVGFAMQWQGDLPHPAPLLGLHRQGQPVQLCAAPPGEHLAMDGYAGSIAISSEVIGITSPRGGRVHLFDHAGAFLAAHQRRDICGLASNGGALIATDGLGGFWQVKETGLSLLARAERMWDNHLVPCRAPTPKLKAT